MTTALDLMEISGIDGVKNAILYSKAGDIIASSDPSFEAPPGNRQNFITALSSDCEKIAHIIGATKIIHITISRKNRENVILFSIGSHILGITKKAEAKRSSLIKEISRFMIEMKKRQNPNNKE